MCDKMPYEMSDSHVTPMLFCKMSMSSYHPSIETGRVFKLANVTESVVIPNVYRVGPYNLEARGRQGSREKDFSLSQP